MVDGRLVNRIEGTPWSLHSGTRTEARFARGCALMVKRARGICRMCARTLSITLVRNEALPSAADCIYLRQMLVLAARNTWCVLPNGRSLIPAECKRG